MIGVAIAENRHGVEEALAYTGVRKSSLKIGLVQ